jgi:hypothetical protein
VPVTELRNRAALASSGDVLAYVDADNEIVPEWAASAVDTLRLPNVGATGAAYHAPPDGTWVQRAYGHLRGRPAGRKDVEWLGSGNLAVWRSVLDRVGGFDPSLDTCEDVDLCHRIRATGLRVVSDERLRNVHHGDPATLWDLFKGELWRGRDNLRVSLRRPLSWRTVVTALIPMAEVATMAAAVTGLAIAGSGGLWLAAATLMLLSVPACLKVVRAAYREQHAGGVGLAETFAVAWVYDMARALALVARMPHRGRSTTVEY